jgi:DNA-binding transcriptional ArsR family regulator
MAATASAPPRNGPGETPRARFRQRAAIHPSAETRAAEVDDAESTEPILFALLPELTRRRIVDELCASERSVTDRVGALAVSQPAVSKRLRVLRESGLVSCGAAAQQRIYRLEAARWTLVFVRVLRHPAETMCAAALTDAAQLSSWAPFTADRNLGESARRC